MRSTAPPLRLFRRELSADCETPLSVFARLRGAGNCFLLESAEGGESWGRYSIIGFEPACIAVEKNRQLHLSWRDGKDTILPDKDILGWLKHEVELAEPLSSDDLPFSGGAVGFFSYDIVHRFESLQNRHQLSDQPLAAFLLVDRFVVFDNLRGSLFLCIRAEEGSNVDGLLDDIESRLTGPGLAPMHLDANIDAYPGPQAEMTPQEFEANVEHAKEYILAGDIFQVVLSQRFSAPLSCDPIQIYRAVRHINPSPYLFYLHVDNTLLIGSSPEILVRKDGCKAVVRPIAGTRPRGCSQEEDEAFEKDLLSDDKELAEHVMLVDLGRNDLGRVCQYGSVQLTESTQIERYSHVMHIVSNVEGVLADGVGCLDLLAATFPAGTVSGAPKIRAMQIINELEPMARGPYAGAVGYISFGGERMDTAISIRTAVIQAGRVQVQAGAGIVADSLPSREHQECVNKATAMFRAVALAEAQQEKI
ncbi:MAG: anthranilate synthase component I family protein [Mariprofundaceae bacterium]